MASARVNLAVTQDGERYNKLKRPEDYAASLTRKRPVPENRDISFESDRSPKRTKANIPTSPSKNENGLSKLRESAVDAPEVRVPVDANCGMRFGFPVLDDGYSSDETTNEALAYLRGVRSEAQSIPNVLLAPKPEDPDDDSGDSIYNEGRGDFRAYYKDGTWIARDLDRNDHAYGPSESDHDVDLDPRESYNNRLLTRYQALRRKLAKASSAGFVKLKDEIASEGVDEAPPRNRREWLYVLSRKYPTISQLSRLSQRNVFQGILYATHSLDRFGMINRQQSCWIWTLLAKAGEHGTLNHHKIGVLRELARKAGVLQNRLRDGYFRERDYYTSNEEDDAESWEAEDGGISSDVRETSSYDDAVEKGIEEAALAVESGNISESGEDDQKSDICSPRNNANEKLRAAEKQSSNTPVDHILVAIEEKRPEEKDPSTLEEARARLLAQLGDRLVQTKTYMSRFDAEAQRQKIRDQQLALAKAEGLLKSDMNTSPQTEKETTSSKSQVPDQAESKLRKQPQTEAEQPRPDSLCKPETQSHHDADNGKMEVNGSRKDGPVVDPNTKVTLDMIITVVAERYGQKDLLQYREIWVK